VYNVGLLLVGIFVVTFVGSLWFITHIRMLCSRTAVFRVVVFVDVFFSLVRRFLSYVLNKACLILVFCVLNIFMVTSSVCVVLDWVIRGF
jgi:hypothetical protein